MKRLLSDLTLQKSFLDFFNVACERRGFRYAPETEQMESARFAEPSVARTQASRLAQSIRAVCSLSLGAVAMSTLPARADDAQTLDTVVVEGDRVNVIPTEPLESVFGFGK